MGCEPLFCCFKAFQPIIINIIALIVNAIAIIFLIWALADLDWDVAGPKGLYITSFILLILILIGLIILLIFLIQRKGQNYISINKMGTILCILTFYLTNIFFFFIMNYK